MSECNHAGDKGDGQEGIQGAIEDVPKGYVVSPHFVEFGHFVSDESEGHKVEDSCYPVASVNGG